MSLLEFLLWVQEQDINLKKENIVVGGNTKKADSISVLHLENNWKFCRRGGQGELLESDYMSEHHAFERLYNILRKRLQERMTNADRIRVMDDEELLDFLLAVRHGEGNELDSAGNLRAWLRAYV